MTYFSKVSAQALIYISFHFNNISKLNIFLQIGDRNLPRYKEENEPQKHTQNQGLEVTQTQCVPNILRELVGQINTQARNISC